MRSHLVLSLGLLAALAVPSASFAGKADDRALKAAASRRATPEASAAVPTAAREDSKKLEAVVDFGDRVFGGRDLVVELLNPTGPHYPVVAKIQNTGAFATGSAFQLSVVITAMCEVGKLKTGIAAQNPAPVVQPLAAGATDFVAIMPASQVWSDQCYSKVAVVVDATNVVGETNESNNSDSNTFCPPGGSCY